MYVNWDLNGSLFVEGIGLGLYALSSNSLLQALQIENLPDEGLFKVNKVTFLSFRVEKLKRLDLSLNYIDLYYRLSNAECKPVQQCTVNRVQQTSFSSWK